MRVVVAGGRVLDPSQRVDRVADVVIEDGRIAAITEPGEATQADETVSADGLLVTPGLIDPHVHLREPGFEYKEDIESGTRAAAAGGFTRVCCMPNTQPAIDTAAVARQILERAQQVGSARVHPIGAATRDMNGEQLSEMADLKQAGVVAISDDAFPIQNAETMRRVMEYCAMLGLPLLTHNEEKRLTERGAMNEGFAATIMGVPGMPVEAEDIAAARNIFLARLTRCRLHLLHISTAGTVQLLKEAKEAGLPVTGEACPHHWGLTEEACLGFRTEAKMNPPLRSQSDADAVADGLGKGIIDCIATDHAPHARHEKEVEFEAAPFGILGLETAWPLVYTTLVLQGRLMLSEAITLMTSAPARILLLEKGAGTLQRGAPADVTLIDLGATWQVDPGAFRSKSRNTPFAGWKLNSRPICTLVGGRRQEA